MACYGESFAISYKGNSCILLLTEFWVLQDSVFNSLMQKNKTKNQPSPTPQKKQSPPSPLERKW